MTAPANLNLDFLGSALQLRAQRQQLIAGNIANADTPGFAARDFNFAQALEKATARPGQAAPGTGSGRAMPVASDARHMGVAAGATPGTPAADAAYELSTQPAVDGNSVDLDRERGRFADNAVRYESTLRFINSHVRTMLSAIQGQ